MTGRIIKNISNDYTIESDNKLYICKPCGKLRMKNITPLVGDFVEFDENNNYLLNILPRKNELIRPSIANVDYGVIVQSVKDPDLDLVLLDKSLTIISYNNITPIIYFSKLDLLNNEELKKINTYISYYQQIGYLVSTTPVDLLNKIKEKTVVLTGQSGAGKSTLLNTIDHNLNLKTAEISYALGRGKHTTRHTELVHTHHPFIVETPGFSKIDIIGMSNIAIRDNMKEMFDNLEYCKYQDCMHVSEDGCHVIELVNNNKILKSRYQNYLNFIKR